MVRFLGYSGPKVFEIPHLPRLSKPTLFFLKTKKKKANPKERDPPQRSQGHIDSFSHLRTTEPDNGPVDPAT